MIGLQGVIGALPIGLDEQGVFKYNYLKKNIYFKEISEVINLSFISELFIDFKSEGYKNSFNKNLLTYFKSIKVPLIVFGGLSDSDQIRKILRKRKISAICVGNSLNYKENKIQYLKKVLNISQLREPAYQIEGKINV